VIRLAIRVDSAQAEVVLAELLQLAPTGVEEVRVSPGIVEYAVYGAPGELPRLPDLSAAVGEALVEISTSEMADDWQERWRQFHKPVLIDAPRPRAAGDRTVPSLRVRPPWEAPSTQTSAQMQEIVIDPGQAFGTGAHASTRTCMELLLELAAREGTQAALLDIGTGSGVLAIAAARLGFRPVLGLDHEPESLHAARENAAENGAQIEVRRFDLRSQPLPWVGEVERRAGPVVVLANLLRPLLLELAGRLPAAPTHLLAGGLLSGEVDEVSHAFAERLSLHERLRRQTGEWAAIWLQAG
jgi:ribosomal protein L11 methyltransferase